jgi:hypothetical protein
MVLIVTQQKKAATRDASPKLNRSPNRLRVTVKTRRFTMVVVEFSLRRTGRPRDSEFASR